MLLRPAGLVSQCWRDPTQARVDNEYDEVYYLTREVRTGSLPYDKRYTYDDVGNRLTMIADGVTTYYHYDAANKLFDYGSSNDPPYTGNTFLDYDCAGNQISKQEGSVVTTYAYNFANRLTEVEVGGVTTAEFTYDGDNLRRSATFASGTTWFLYDEDRVIGEVDGQGALMAFYSVGNGSLIARLAGGSGQYYHADGLGSAKALTMAQTPPTVSDAYAYDAWAFPWGTGGPRPSPMHLLAAWDTTHTTRTPDSTCFNWARGTTIQQRDASSRVILPEMV